MKLVDANSMISSSTQMPTLIIQNNINQYDSILGALNNADMYSLMCNTVTCNTVNGLTGISINVTRSGEGLRLTLNGTIGNDLSGSVTAKVIFRTAQDYYVIDSNTFVFNNLKPAIATATIKSGTKYGNDYYITPTSSLVFDVTFNSKLASKYFLL